MPTIEDQLRAARWRADRAEQKRDEALSRAHNLVYERDGLKNDLVKVSRSRERAAAEATERVEELRQQRDEARRMLDGAAVLLDHWREVAADLRRRAELDS